MALRHWTAILAMLLSAAAARAVQPRIVFAPGRPLEAGEVVTVGWEGLPSGVDELEFLLSTGHHEVFRLTPQFIPSQGSFGWTVPNLPSSAAVLELRVGIDGEEMVIASSEPFVIRGMPHKTRVEFYEGEWWAFETATPPADAPVIQPVTHTGAARTFVRPRQWLPRVRMDLVDTRQVDAPEVSSSCVDTRCGAPLVVPQRK